jgi:hypothetical protein
MREMGKTWRAGELGVSGGFRSHKSHKCDSRQEGGRGGEGGWSLGQKTGWLASRDAKRTWTLVVGPPTLNPTPTGRLGSRLLSLTLLEILWPPT